MTALQTLFSLPSRMSALGVVADLDRAAKITNEFLGTRPGHPALGGDVEGWRRSNIKAYEALPDPDAYIWKPDRSCVPIQMRK